MNEPKIMIQEKTLSILLALDGERFCAYCPELDLVTEMDTPEEAIFELCLRRICFTLITLTAMIRINNEVLKKSNGL